MSSQRSRRDFLKLSACGVAVAGATDLATFTGSAAPAPKSDEIGVRITGGELRYQSQPGLKWKSGGGAKGNVIEVNPAKRYQEMLGFGAAFTDSACYTFNRLDASARDALFHELFHPAEKGLNVCRTC